MTMFSSAEGGKDLQLSHLENLVCQGHSQYILRRLGSYAQTMGVSGTDSSVFPMTCIPLFNTYILCLNPLFTLLCPSLNYI